MKKSYEERKEWYKEYYQRNKEKYAERGRIYYQENKEKKNNQSKKWRKNHPEQIRYARRKRTHEKRIELLSLLGGKCVVCGEIDWRCLQIDHVNGGGRKEIFEIANGYLYYTRVKQQILEGSKNYQLLCANHNMIKTYENKEGYIGFDK